MAITILLVCFIVTFLNAGVIMSAETGKREVFICSLLILSVLTVFITEFLSACHLIGFTCILISWTVIALFGIAYLFTKKTGTRNFLNSLKRRGRLIYSGLTGFEKFLVCSIAVLIILIFAQGIIYPPNNWDSMAYHMARIPNWISHKSLAPYPTNITRQLYQPPFAEYFIMNLDILNRADYFSNAVQLFFLLASLIAIGSIANSLGLSRRYQIIAIVLGATLPEVVLQASSTQNDIVVSFFILTSCFFSIKAVKETVFRNYLFLGLAVGLGILTKGTAYIFLAPVLLIFGIAVLIGLFRYKNYKALWYSIFIVFIVIAINTPEYYRNYKVSKSILGTDKKDMNAYSNETMSPLLFLSSVEKNAGLHMGIIGTNRIAILADDAIFKLHNIEGVNVNNPANNFGHTKYSSPRVYAATHEDSAPNFIHLILIVISFVLIGLHALKNKLNTTTKLLLLVIFLQGLIFCIYLKWQPWNSRLHTPVFMLSVLVISYAGSIGTWFKKVLNVLMPLILFYALIIVLHNATRPYFAPKMLICETRYEKYFANIPDYYAEYDVIVKDIQRYNYKNIGLMIGADTYEYPLFTQCYSQVINPVSINVDNITKNLQPVTQSIDCIVSTTVNHAFIDYNGKRFYNQGSKNKHIYFYK